MIVVDTSVAIKWLNKGEENSEQAFLLYKNHITQRETIIVPELLFIEAANALSTKKIIPDSDIQEGINFLFASHFTIQTLTEDLLVEAAFLAKQHQTSVYDMLYAVLAKHNNTLLITADKKFKQRVNLSFIRNLNDLK